ncbi:MAG: alcohol dehydrogenase catalytic domain-containing protein [Phycisphaerae bacterium]|nr:alcohol dehydrogenase catalytic domain-containing protein [Phycisphaerae bacterium]
MKAYALTGIRQMELHEIDNPVVKHDKDVLLKIEMVGVCGSDVHYYETGRIGSQVVEYPYIVGHECAATVVEVGRAVTHVKPGDPVVVDPAAWCDTCDQCRMGRENTCRNLSFLGTPGQGPGCLSEYILMPEKSCFPTHDAITLEQAVLCEPFAIGVYAVKRSPIARGAKIAILGSGPIGLSCLTAARAEGVDKIYITDRIAARLAVAAAAGAAWTGNPDTEDIVETIASKEPSGIDIVYECAGQQEALNQGIDLLRPGGVLMIVGIPRAEQVSFSIDKIRRKEITIINVRRQNQCTQLAIDLLATRKACVDFMVTHRFAFDHSREAFDLVADYRDGVVKALIKV